jgi:hypothetical protein
MAMYSFILSSNILVHLFANCLVPFVLCVEQKVCIRVYIHKKCSLSERFIFQNSLKKENTDKGWHLKIPFMQIQVENILNRKSNVFTI